MNAAETIQAAIDKLTGLRDESTSSPWSVDEIPETGECRVIREFEFFGGQLESVTGGGSHREDADLIVTLHRTIDAQLAILAGALGDIARWVDPDSEYGWEPCDGPTPNGAAFADKLTLAIAILGDDS